MQRLFLDSEFTDFINCQLISIGCVTEDGKHEFYAEISDYDRGAESEFVRENIIPLLDGGSARMTYNEASARFGSWVEGLPYDNVVICIDYKTDWDLMTDLLDNNLPQNIDTNWMNIFHDMQGACIIQCIKRDNAIDAGTVMAEDVIPLSTAFKEHHKIFHEKFLEHFFVNRHTPKYAQHHALYDARANRQGWLAAMEYISKL